LNDSSWRKNALAACYGPKFGRFYAGVARIHDSHSHVPALTYAGTIRVIVTVLSSSLANVTSAKLLNSILELNVFRDHVMECALKAHLICCRFAQAPYAGVAVIHESHSYTPALTYVGNTKVTVTFLSSL